jgi:acetyl esterase/lipase
MCGVLADAGVATATLGYDLCPAITLGAMVAQVAVAVRWLQQRHAGVPLTLGGHSAGAHLAAMALHALGPTHGLAGARSHACVLACAHIKREKEKV